MTDSNPNGLCTDSGRNEVGFRSPYHYTSLHYIALHFSARASATTVAGHVPTNSLEKPSPNATCARRGDHTAPVVAGLAR